ncbi:zinc finger protein 644-like isoform X1 [Myxocyprinus asiaticus]|uniref:zinc finger protein 644-like isoform X1 n=1 Tax=Myxocyprinus asiaticus TaxID=70543 RepID=UPI0022238DA7|nr:zinc finger protein 644-like isoform X1 [Myxocyprinus asiaticus]
MSGLKKSAKVEENDTSMSKISQELLNSQTFCPQGTTSETSVLCPQDTMALLCDQGDLLTSIGFMDSICTDGPAKAAYVNGSTSPNISDEILLDISKNVPGFLPRSFHAQNSVTTNVHFEEPDPLRKEGEITIKQTLTAEDVENRGIWGFDTESPEGSLDHFDDVNDLSWDPQKEFMKFLWDDDNGIEMEGNLPPVASPLNHKRRVPSPLGHERRKRKSKILLKVDPSEELYPNLDFDSKNDKHGEGSQKDCSTLKKIRSPRKPSKSRSPIAKTTKHLNGAAEAAKHPFPKPEKKPISKTQRFGLTRENLTTGTSSKAQPKFLPCNNNFTEKSKEYRQTTFNTDTTSSMPFICKECGQCYQDQSSLLNHVNVHQVKGKKNMEEINEVHKMKDAKLQCPQCTFGTNCPNTFVKHAKTHEKDKRYYSCNKCDFVEMNEVELRRHLLQKHGISDADLTIWKSDGVQLRKVDRSDKNSAAPHPISKSIQSHSRLDKSIHTLLSRQKHSNQSASECNSHQSPHGISATGFPDTDKCLSDDSFDCETTLSRTKRTSSPSKCQKRPVNSKERNRKSTSKFDGNSTCLKDFGNRSTPKYTNLGLEKQTLKKSPSKRKTSTPFHNMQGQDILLDFPKCRQNFKKHEASNNDFLCDSNHDLGACLTKECEVKEDLNVSTRLVRRQTLLAEGRLCASSNHFERDHGSPRTFSVKEKEVYDDGSESNPVVKHESYTDLKKDLNACPYIPADFESAEVDTSQTKRHAELPTDYQQTELMCPLCMEVFVTRTGLSNHVRGHLKRLGKPASTTSKSPVILLKELMRDKKQFEMKLQVLEKKCRGSRSLYPIILRNGLTFTSKTPREKKWIENYKSSPPSDLIGFLKKMRANEETEAKQPSHTDSFTEVDTSKTQTEHQAKLLTDCKLTELVCPLCRDRFETGTGLSNHVRGHLKRLGKPTSTASKSPVILLKELMRDKKQFQMKLQVLKKKSCTSSSLYAVRLSNRRTFRSTGKRYKHVYSRSREEKKSIESNKGSPPSDLIGILKKRRTHEETKAKHPSHTARKALVLPSGKDRGLVIEPAKMEPNSLTDKSELNRKVCEHCNATFHSGVSLSNHLRAYAQRKKKALRDGTTYDCKQRKQRSRSGSKKKPHLLLHTPEEIYTLTCRFCDLVFQGPLSVQEDWIKHLQRHIMNTAVPHTGAGMVEVTSFPKDSCPNTEPHAQPSVMQTSS